jgi:hypothetical protein
MKADKLACLARKNLKRKLHTGRNKEIRYEDKMSG